jgi:ferredoxin-thioredoxin reductase catalytic subunit
MKEIEPVDATEEEVGDLYRLLAEKAESFGYHLNPDLEHTLELTRGLITNEKRYGYQACPCRLASGTKEDDLDIICPCDYRDQDLIEFGSCFCGLYVSEDVKSGKKSIGPLPERRPPPEIRGRDKKIAETATITALSMPVWRCRVCGYLCAKEEPPAICPICKAKRERFERFM